MWLLVLGSYSLFFFVFVAVVNSFDCYTPFNFNDILYIIMQVYKYVNYIHIYTYVLQGDPGYPGPQGLKGEMGQKGMHTAYCYAKMVLRCINN